MKNWFVALSVVAVLALPLLSFDFGITEDEQLHNRHGQSILDYFLGRSDLATRHPIDDDGKLTFRYGAEMQDESGALNIYGGFFDLLCAACYRTLSPLGEFEKSEFTPRDVGHGFKRWGRRTEDAGNSQHLCSHHGNITAVIAQLLGLFVSGFVFLVDNDQPQIG